MMKVDKKAESSAPKNSITMSAENINSIKFAVIFECAGRLLLIGKEKIFNSYSLIMKDKKCNNMDMMGFYSGAEIGLTKKTSSGVHAYTCTTLVFGDELLLE